MEESFVKAPPSHINFATQLIAHQTRLTTERNSVQSSTANSLEDGTTPGGRIPKWMVRQTCHKYQGNKSKNRNHLERFSIFVVVAIYLVFFPSRSRCMQALLLC